MLRAICLYYDRFLPPYVDGVLQARRPVICRRLQRHIAACPRCRLAIAELVGTHAELRRSARLSQAQDVWSQPPRATWRRRSLSDRVAAQLGVIELAAHRRRVAARICLITAVVAAGLVVVAQPSPAREWLVNSFLRTPLAAFAPPPPKTTASPTRSAGSEPYRSKPVPGG